MSTLPPELARRIDAAKEASDLAEVVGRTVTLRKAGRELRENRQLRLILQHHRAPIPELRGMEHRIQHARAVALAMLSADAGRGRIVVAMIREAFVGIMACRAGDAIVR